MAAKRKARKRMHGSGAVVPPAKPGGTWGVRIRVNGRREYRGGFPTRELAEQVLAMRQARGVATSHGLPVAHLEAGTLGEHAVGFLERRKRTHSAHKEDAGRWNKHLAPVFGHLKPSEVDQALVRRFVEAKLAGGLASGTVRILVALLSSLFVELVEERLATSNPARGLPRKVTRLLVPDHDPKTTPFVERLADVDRIFRKLPEPLNVGFALGAMAGLRTSEVFGLRWRSVDLAGRRIHVSEQRGGRRLKDRDSRMVPILDGLFPILTAWQLKTGGKGDTLVCPSMRGGKHIARRVPWEHLARVLKELGLERPGLGWYECTRHTFASQWVIHGGSIEKLKEILGHYSVVMTERYAHLRVDLFSAGDLGTIPLSLGQGTAAVVPMKRGEA